MGLEIESLRYAHGPGHTDVCYGSNNRNIFTCGSDGYVRIWDDPNDDDATSDFVADQALSVACTKDGYLVATNNNYVQGYNYADRKRDKIVFRFSAPVTHVAVSCSGKFIAACSCDMEIQVLESKKNEITTLSGHKAPVLGISLDPLDEYLVSSSCDGTVKIWELSSGLVVKNINNAVPIKNDFFKALVLARCAWKSTSGLFLAVPEGMNICVYKRSTWAEVYRLSSKNIEKDLSAVLFSPCGNYVAAASIIGEVIIWEIKHKSQVCCYKDPKKVGISGIVWHPDGSKILFCDRLGRLGVLTGISEEISKHSAPLDDEIKTSTDDTENINEIMDSNSISDEDDGYDRDDENCISLEKIKATYKSLSDDYDNDAEEQRDCASPVGSTDTSIVRESNAFLPKSQPAFQPSSTPFNYEPRCLCYNEIGMVRYYNSDRTIDILFHDTMFHHSLFLRSFGFCTMATLSLKVLCLAVPSVEDKLSKLTCICLGSWAGNKEWTVQMPAGENILAITASGNWVAVATSSNYLRIFSHAGTQKQVLALPGSIVCMSGYSQKLLIVYNVGPGLVGSQNLGFTVYQISSIHVQTIIPFQPVPLSPKSTLTWLGFSDEGTPCTYDSEGILRLLGQDFSHWLVICDTKNLRKSTSDHYFVVGLSETNQNVRSILCRNSHYPLVINNPTVVEIPLKIPLCEIEEEKSIAEEAFWRLMFSFNTMQKISLDDTTLFKSFELPMNQAILKLFGSAINNSEDLRAVDLASLMTKKLLDIAIQYSNNQGKGYLVEKLKVLKPLDWSCCYQPVENLQSNSYVLGNVRKESYLDDEIDNNIVINSQQDLFEDSEAIVEKENKPSCSQEFESASKCSSATSKNPFKKPTAQTNESIKGLKYFDSLSKIPPKQSKPFNANKSLNLKLLSHKEKDIEVKPKKITFMEWFSKRKNSLSEEYPNLSSSELTKMSMKIYKAEMKNTENNSDCTRNKGNILLEELISVEKDSKKHSSEDMNESDAKRFKSMDDSL